MLTKGFFEVLIGRPKWHQRDVMFGRFWSKVMARRNRQEYSFKDRTNWFSPKIRLSDAIKLLSQSLYFQIILKFGKVTIFRLFQTILVFLLILVFPSYSELIDTATLPAEARLDSQKSDL